MKKLILAGLLLFSASAFAGGKLSYQGSVLEHSEKTGDYGHMVGLAIYQNLGSDKVALNSWTGWGNQPLELKENVEWMTTKNQLDFKFSRVTVAPGIQNSYVLPYEQWKHAFYVKLDFQLW